MIPDDAWPAGDRLSWADDDERVVWDFTADPHESRPYTDAENAAADERADAARRSRNDQHLRAAAAAALDGNRAFLALASPTNAQTLAQVKALTRQMNALARLVLGDLEGTD